MKTIFDVTINDSGIDRLSVANRELVETSAGSHNPHAYRLGMLGELEYLVKAVFSESDPESARFHAKVTDEIRKETHRYISSKSN